MAHLNVPTAQADQDMTVVLKISTAVPKSGTSGDGAGTYAAPGSMVRGSTGVLYVNEGSLASPYWTPASFQQRGLLGWYSDWRDGVGKAIDNTDATATLVGSGIRIHGEGIETADDSGLVISMSDQGALARLSTTNEDAHTAVLSVGAGTTPVFQPDQNGTVVVDAEVTNVSAITNRSMFLGFCGSAANALAEVVTGATVTISFTATIGDDVAGLFFDAGLTDADRWFAPHDKGNANASIATTATGVDTGVDVAAAGVYQRLRVEVDADGAVRCFINKALVASFAAATLDVDEEIHPVLILGSATAGIQSLDVKHFGAWGARV